MFRYETKPPTTPLRSPLHYRLYRLQHGQHPPIFRIEIRFGEDCFCTPLATHDSDEARRIYGLMLAGKVTPCTAEDVLKDLQD